MKTCGRTSLVVLPLLFAFPLFAQRQTLTINPESSNVSFTLGGSGHETQGTFHVQNGTIDFDRANPKLSGSVVVAAVSGKTGNDSRDKKMTNEVLDAPHFADVSFAPQSYQGAIAPFGDSTIQVTGTFTLHGTPHESDRPYANSHRWSELHGQDPLHRPVRKVGIEGPEHLHPQSCQGSRRRSNPCRPTFELTYFADENLTSRTCKLIPYDKGGLPSPAPFT